MKYILVSFIILNSCYAALDEKLLAVDPYSISSMAEHFPNAVISETMIDANPIGHFKRTSPVTKEVQRINYETLVPHLILAIQEQQKEIAQLKENSKR